MHQIRLIVIFQPKLLQSVDVESIQSYHQRKTIFLAVTAMEDILHASVCVLGRDVLYTVAAKGAIIPMVRDQSKREREPHTWQLMDITNRIFMEKKGENKAHGGWSELENIIFSNAFQHLEMNMMECDSASLLFLFNSVVRHVNAPHTSFELPINSILRHKSKEQIEGKICDFNREKKLVEQLNTC